MPTFKIRTSKFSAYVKAASEDEAIAELRSDGYEVGHRIVVDMENYVDGVVCVVPHNYPSKINVSKANVSDIIQRALAGYCPDFKAKSGHVKWGAVEFAIKAEFDKLQAYYDLRKRI